MTNYEKTIKKLERETRKEYKKVLDFAEKEGDIRCNDNDVKITSVLGFGGLTWAMSMIAMPFIIGTGALPVEIIQPLFVAVPTAIGVGSTIALTKTFKNKERLRKRTSAKTQVERTVASTKLEVEKEKHRAKMNILTDIIEEIKDSQLAESTIPGEILKTQASKDDRTVEDLTESISSVEASIEDRMQELDLIVTKKTLKERFWRVRDKNQQLTDIALIGALSVLAGFIVYNVPLLAMNGVYEVSSTFLQMIAPGLITGAAATGYAIKHKHDEMEAFKILNLELLGEEALPETTDDTQRKRKIAGNKTERFDLALKGKTNELVALRTFLEEEKDRKEVKFGEESILFQEFEPIEITAEMRQHVVEHPEQYQNCPSRIRQGKFYTDDEYERRAEEILSTPLPGDEDKGIAFTLKDKRK